MNRTHPANLPETPSAPRSRGCRGGLFQASLKAYLDGETSAIRAWLVRGHLAQCAECREELRWLRRLGEDMKELESTRPRPELRARILASLPTTPPAPGIRVVHSRPDQERTRLAPRLALAGGLAMILAFSGVFALKRSPVFAASTRQDAARSIRSGLKPVESPQESADAEQAENGPLKMVTYTPEEDPNNAVADRMFHAQMAEIERQQAQMGQDDWHRLLAQARAAAYSAASAKPTEMGIALAVPNIDSVRAHLPGWAKKEGAELIATGRPTSVATELSGLPSLRDEDPRANRIAFYVPAQRGPAFLGALKQIGQISALPPTSRPLRSGSPNSTAQTQTELASDNRSKAIPTAPVAADPGTMPEKTIALHEKRPKSERYLVLTVFLTTVHN
jgi:anti-sigma factor RsiW